MIVRALYRQLPNVAKAAPTQRRAYKYTGEKFLNVQMSAAITR